MAKLKCLKCGKEYYDEGNNQGVSKLIDRLKAEEESGSSAVTKLQCSCGNYSTIVDIDVRVRQGNRIVTKKINKGWEIIENE